MLKIDATDQKMFITEKQQGTQGLNKSTIKYT